MWNIRNFTRHDGNILNPRVNHFNTNHDNLFRYEFPIMQWSMSLCQKVFAEDIQVIRILTFIIGIFSIFGMYFLVFLIFKNKNTALISAILFQYSPVFYFYTVNPIPDNLSLCTVIWYIYFILLFYENKQTKHLLLASFFLLLATLSKLPFLLFSIISIYYFFRDIIQKKTISRENIFNSFTQLIFILPALLWYAWVIPGWQGNPILTGIFKTGLFNYENLMILKFHFLKMFPLLLLSPPIWILFVLGLISLKSAAVQSYLWLVLLILMTFLFLILEFSAINIVHDYYMFPFLPWHILLFHLVLNI
ncbi:MAG: glycosyltransferase family 39 protein [Saprospiraceae bacterium]|nr:glycosyltransferase family 39 protein [Saprospiraceae bacterium]